MKPNLNLNYYGKNYLVHVPFSIHYQLKDYCIDNGVKLSDFSTALIINYLNNLNNDVKLVKYDKYYSQKKGIFIRLKEKDITLISKIAHQKGITKQKLLTSIFSIQISNYCHKKIESNNLKQI